MIMDQRDQAPARAEAKGRRRKKRSGEKETTRRGESLSNSVDARTLSGSDVVGKGLSYWKWG